MKTESVLYTLHNNGWKIPKSAQNLSVHKFCYWITTKKPSYTAFSFINCAAKLKRNALLCCVVSNEDGCLLMPWWKVHKICQRGWNNKRNFLILHLVLSKGYSKHVFINCIKFHQTDKIYFLLILWLKSKWRNGQISEMNGTSSVYLQWGSRAFLGTCVALHSTSIHQHYTVQYINQCLMYTEHTYTAAQQRIVDNSFWIAVKIVQWRSVFIIDRCTRFYVQV